MRHVRVSQFQLPATALMITLVCLANSVARADGPKNEVIKHWLKFKPGSSVTMGATMAMGGMSIQTEMKNTLISVDGDKITLQTVSTTIFNGQRRENPPQTQVIDANTDQGTWDEVGKEKIEAGGKTYDCRVVEGKMTAPPSRGGPGAPNTPPTTTKAKIWVNDDIPGGAVQMKVTTGMQGMQDIVFKLISYEAK